MYFRQQMRLIINFILEQEFVTQKQLEIKKVYFNQLGFAISCIRKMDEARSVFDKINLIINAHTSINNTIKFSS